jgi:hypothetical protein
MLTMGEQYRQQMAQQVPVIPKNGLWLGISSVPVTRIRIAAAATKARIRSCAAVVDG